MTDTVLPEGWTLKLELDAYAATWLLTTSKAEDVYTRSPGVALTQNAGDFKEELESYRTKMVYTALVMDANLDYVNQAYRNEGGE